MSLFSRVVDFLRGHQHPVPTVTQLEAGSEAWSETSYLARDAKYNPDDLLGRKGFDIYKRMMIDEQVKAVVHFKRSSVTGREWFFTLDHRRAGLSEEEAAKRVDIYTTMLEEGYHGSFVDGMNCIERAMWQGFSMTEQIFNQFQCQGKTYWGIHELKPKPFETFYPYVDQMGQIVRWVQRGGPGFAERTIDMSKMVYYRYNADMDEHYGWSDLRAAYRAYISKDVTIKFMNIFMERLAGGFPVAKPQEGYTLRRESPEWIALQKVMQNLSVKSSIILPTGIDLEIVQTTGNNVEVFTQAIECHDLAIAKALLVPNLLGVSHTGKTGSYSQSDTQLDAFMIGSDQEADRLARTLNDQIFTPLGKVNFPDGIAPKIAFRSLSKRQRIALIQTWKDLVGSAAVIASETDEAHIRKSLGFPERGEPLPVPVVPGQSGAGANQYGDDDDGSAGRARPGQGVKPIAGERSTQNVRHLDVAK